MKPIQTDLFGTPTEQFNPRWYQVEVVDKVMWELEQGLTGGSVICLPTGAGKSCVIAMIAERVEEKFGSQHGILVVQPSKELLEQNYEKLSMFLTDDKIGVFSASMNERTISTVTLATIGSIYKKPHLFKNIKLVLFDECDLFKPAQNEEDYGMVMKFLSAINNPKVIGLTASPYRMGTGYANNGDQKFPTVKMINRLEGGFWKRILYNLSTAQLMKEGYLCPIEYVPCETLNHSSIGTNAGGTDFDEDEMTKALRQHGDVVTQAILWGLDNCKSVLVFCPSVASAEELAIAIPGAAVVTGKTLPDERERIIRGFKDGSIRCVMNMGVLTTGFDHPGLDCIVLARPTRSLRLYCQMVGRGVRKADGKTSCKVLDVAGVVKHLGRFETIEVVKNTDGKWDVRSEKGTWHGRDLMEGTKPKPKDFGKLECEKCGAVLPTPDHTC